MSRKNLVVIEKHMESLVVGSPCTEEVTLKLGRWMGSGAVVSRQSLRGGGGGAHARDKASPKLGKT